MINIQIRSKDISMFNKCIVFDNRIHISLDRNENRQNAVSRYQKGEGALIRFRTDQTSLYSYRAGIEVKFVTMLGPHIDHCSLARETGLD